MDRVSSIFSQIVRLVPRGLFDGAVARHQGEKHAKGMTCWSQFVALEFCHLGGARSLREITGGLATSERVKWIEQLRQDISSFSGLIHTWCFSGFSGKAEENGVLQEIDRLRHVIRLRLNPDGTHDCKIQRLIAKIPLLTDPSKQPELEAALDDLIVTTQLLLKEEWEKGKWESEHGNLKRES